MPGLSPLPYDRWIVRDDAFNDQMALKDKLAKDHLPDIYAISSGIADMREELLDLVLEQLKSDPDYVFDGQCVTRPDGVTIDTHELPPLVAVGRLIQEDIAILRPVGGEYVLGAGFIAFPASWTLKEKIGRPLHAIHDPVTGYTPDMARRIHRILTQIQHGAALQRANFLKYNDPTLYQPRTEGKERPFSASRKWWLRVETQSIFKLPRSGGIIFAIHTWQTPAAELSPTMRAKLAQ